MRKEFKFKAPELILSIVENKRDNAYEKILQKGLELAGQRYILLSLYIEPKNLKKMLTAIKLMDIAGVYLPEAYRKNSKYFIDKSQSKSPTNVIVLKDNKYQGHNTLRDAYHAQLKILKNLKKSSVSVFGNKENTSILLDELQTFGLKDIYVIPAQIPDTRHQMPDTDMLILCGTSSKIPHKLVSRMKDGALLVDMREGVKKYPKYLEALGKNLTKNHTFLAHLTAASVKIWTNKSIDTAKLDQALRRF